MDDELMKCPVCGTPRVSRYAAYCHVCGSPLPELPPDPDEPADPPAGQDWEDPATTAGEGAAASANPAGSYYPGAYRAGPYPGPVRQDYSSFQQPAQEAPGTAAQPARDGVPAQGGGVAVYDRPETPPSVVRRRRLTWILLAIGLLVGILMLVLGPLGTVLGARNQPVWTPPGSETPVATGAVAALPPGVSAAQATARARYTPTFTPTVTPTWTATATATSTVVAGGNEGGLLPTVVLPTLAPAPTATVAPTAVPPTNTVAPPANTAVPAPTATAVPPTETAVPPTATSVPPAATQTPSSGSAPVSGADLPRALSGGKAIAFVSDRTGVPQIWVVGAGGGNQVQVTSQGANTSPSWSLDDRYLYYVSSRGDQSGVYRLDLTTGTEELVMQTAGVVSARPLPSGQLASLRTENGRYSLYVGDRRVFQLDRAFQYQFSSDGSRVLIDPNSDPRVISIVDVASTRAQEVAPAKSWNAGWGQGNQITYVSDRSGVAAVYLAGPNGEGAHPISPGDKWSQAPAFSSDASQIAFVAGDGPAWNLYVVGANGQNAHKVADAANPSKSPIWQPGGQLIAFESNRAGNWDIYVTDPSGNERGLTADPGNDVDPAWTW